MRGAEGLSLIQAVAVGLHHVEGGSSPSLSGLSFSRKSLVSSEVSHRHEAWSQS